MAQIEACRGTDENQPHHCLSERIFRVVAETYQCEEAAILVSIVVKPPDLTAGERAGAVGVSPLEKGLADQFSRCKGLRKI